MKVDSTTASMEKTNLLMKLRETLLDNGEKGDNQTVPSGLSRYTNNGMFGIWTWLAILIIIGLIIWEVSNWMVCSITANLLIGEPCFALTSSPQ